MKYNMEINMDKLTKKIGIIFALLLIVFTFYNMTYASDFWNGATDWYKDGSIPQIPADAKAVIDVLVNYINVIGTAIFMIATAVLGIKYIYGSVESKADVKESLVTWLVAALFFFGYSAISNLLYGSNTFILQSDTFAGMVGKVYSTFVYIANLLGIAAVIYIGIKYMLSGASGKADIKAKSAQFILGIIFAFSALNILSFVSKIINEII